MPCTDWDARDHWTDIQNLQERLDRATRIACKALTHIEESGDGLEVLVLKDPELDKWWKEHKEADRRERERVEREEADRREKKRLAELKKQLMKQLSPDEKKALGLK